ncbi:N-acetyltransferase family protein [Rhizobium sp. PAMB 3174]
MISVRQATADDFECLLPLMLDMERHYLGEAAVAEHDARQRLFRILNDNPPDCFLVALDGDEGIGFATLYETFPGLHLHNTWFMKELYVRAGSRGRGAGRLLVEAAGGEGSRRGGTRLEFTA